MAWKQARWPPLFITFLTSPCTVMTPYQVSSEIYGGFFYPGITLNLMKPVETLQMSDVGKQNRAGSIKYSNALEWKRSLHLEFSANLWTGNGITHVAVVFQTTSSHFWVVLYVIICFGFKKDSRSTVRYFELFWPSTKLSCNWTKPENNTLQR